MNANIKQTAARAIKDVWIFAAAVAVYGAIEIRALAGAACRKLRRLVVRAVASDE